MTMPLCPACNEPMEAHGHTFRCEPCRQIIVFFERSGTSLYIPAGEREHSKKES
jgi:tRNA(Ile2) C34 agmatinyltransferase TiaS